MAEKRKFSDGKTFSRPKFRIGQKNFRTKKKSESFSVQKFSFFVWYCSWFVVTQVEGKIVVGRSVTFFFMVKYKIYKYFKLISDVSGYIRDILVKILHLIQFLTQVTIQFSFPTKPSSLCSFHLSLK